MCAAASGRCTAQFDSSGVIALTPAIMAPVHLGRHAFYLDISSATLMHNDNQKVVVYFPSEGITITVLSPTGKALHPWMLHVKKTDNTETVTVLVHEKFPDVSIRNQVRSLVIPDDF
jgi:hypothetical protein